MIKKKLISGYVLIAGLMFIFLSVPIFCCPHNMAESFI